MRRIMIGVALLSALAAAFAVGSVQNQAGKDRPIQLAGCINGVCS